MLRFTWFRFAGQYLHTGPSLHHVKAFSLFLEKVKKIKHDLTKLQERYLTLLRADAATADQHFQETSLDVVTPCTCSEYPAQTTNFLHLNL
jgi:hypothetical protein